tara:strand:- start:75 stop:425 length:351 start_codon:yes stop_codon:yes gene_type:complete
MSTGSTSVIADQHPRNYSSNRTCTRTEYREEYVPGTRNNPGEVRNWEETVVVPCPGVNSTTNQNKIDNNDCTEGKIAGGILGGGLATAVSRGKDRWWAIPAGVIGGSMAGCQIDGG